MLIGFGIGKARDGLMGLDSIGPDCDVGFDFTGLTCDVIELRSDKERCNSLLIFAKCMDAGSLELIANVVDVDRVASRGDASCILLSFINGGFVGSST